MEARGMMPDSFEGPLDLPSAVMASSGAEEVDDSVSNAVRPFTPSLLESDLAFVQCLVLALADGGGSAAHDRHDSAK